MTFGPQDPTPDARWRPQPRPEAYPPADAPTQGTWPQSQPTVQNQPPAQYQLPAAQYQHQYPTPGQYAAPWMRQPAVAPKSAALAVVLSFFIPGLGSMVSSRVGRGILILVLWVVGVVLVPFVVGAFICLGVWIWGMFDGYQAAQAWNRAHGIVS
jgi:TM2 domain-containing membrane protein YozV